MRNWQPYVYILASGVDGTLDAGATPNLTDHTIVGSSTHEPRDS